MAASEASREKESLYGFEIAGTVAGLLEAKEMSV